MFDLMTSFIPQQDVLISLPKQDPNNDNNSRHVNKEG